MESFTAACLCGGVELKVSGQPSHAGHCHCLNCQRATGSAFWTWATFLSAQVSVVRGEVREYQQEDTRARRGFCPNCGSTLTYSSPHSPEELDISMATFIGDVDWVPEKHLYVDRSPKWVNIPVGLPRFGGLDGRQPIEESDS